MRGGQVEAFDWRDAGEIRRAQVDAYLDAVRYELPSPLGTFVGGGKVRPCDEDEQCSGVVELIGSPTDPTTLSYLTNADALAMHGRGKGVHVAGYSGNCTCDGGGDGTCTIA